MEVRSCRGPPPERMLATASFHFIDVPPDTISELKNKFSLLKKSEHVRKMIESILDNSSNPYKVAMQIVSECEDLFHNKTNTLSSLVIEAFCEWAKPREDKIEHNLTPQLKYDAFCLITMQKNSALTKLIIHTFKMPQDKMLFVEKIKDFVRTKKYKEAAQCSVALGLVSHFPIDFFILPLILQDKLPIAEEALATDPKLQMELVTRLDHLVGERGLRNNVDQLVIQLEVPEVKLERFINHKPLGKLIAKLVKTFNLPSNCTPNLMQKRSAGALNFIFHKRFFEKTLSLDAWKEMAYESVRDNITLQGELVDLLSSVNEVEEALYWALEFSVPQHKWPFAVNMLHKSNPVAKCEFPRPSSASNSEKEDWEESNDYHQLSLQDDAIVMVDSEELLRDCFLYISSHSYKIVGIDSEWKPAFGGQQNELALIQLATWDKIFILDIIGTSNVNPRAWEEASRLFFENPDVLKLGFSLTTDMNIIKNAIPQLSNIKICGSGYLDLSLVWRRLQHKGLCFNYAEHKDSSGESLSRLVYLCLGRYLNKSDQFSNWEQRPLRHGQKRYAALDAFCLLEVHKQLQRLADEQGLPFLEVCDEIVMGYRSPKKTLIPGGFRRGRGGRGRGAHRNPGQGSSQGQEEGPKSQAGQSVYSIKFATDHMLLGLGRQLRKCGIDCFFLEGAMQRKPHQEAQATLQSILFEKRIVLTQGSNVEWFTAHLSAEHVYCVHSATSPDQLQDVLDHFKIGVREVDIFTRCMVCNSNAFDRISQEKMLELAVLTESSQHGNASETTSESEIISNEIISPALAGGMVKLSDRIRKWVLSDDPPNVLEGKTLLGVKIQVQNIPAGVLHKVKTFYVCSICGKVYWEGTHFYNQISQYKESGAIQEDGQFSDVDDEVLQ